MLEPRDRQLLFEALRPPVGYQFDHGLGTTFTLDLMALLVAPIAFTAFERVEDANPAANSLGWLESLRRHADRLTLFCHAGYTAVPRAQYPQLAFIEESIVECLPENGGTFHPKVWVLRYLGDGPVKYRVLNLSRNLTFSRSWDTMLTLDGDVAPKPPRRAANEGLVDFVRALASFGVRQVRPSVVERLATIAEELDRTELRPPAGIESLQFWPLGLPGRRQNPFAAKGKRLLIVSPFVTLGALEDLAGGTTECTLVSTPPQLAALARRPEGVTSFKVLSDRAIAEAEPQEGDRGIVSPETVADAIQQGQLHAKLYVSDTGASAHVWTGSANATQSGLGANVEMLVEMVGPKRQFGIDTLMAPEPNELRFINLLVDAEQTVAAEPMTEEERELERAFDSARGALAAAQLEAHVAADGAGAFGMKVVTAGGTPVHLPPRITAAIRPITLTWPPVPITGAAEVATFDAVSFDALTAFFEVELQGRLGGEDRVRRFVLTLPMLGAPADRRDRILRSMLSDRKKVLRFLMLLLAEEGLDGPAGDERSSVDTASNGQDVGFAPTGLLEMLLRALDNAPTRLDHVESLLGQLSRDEDGQALLPDGFEAVWVPIWQHRQRLREDQP